MNLEEYIKNNKPDFDQEEPSNKVWEGVELELNNNFKTVASGFGRILKIAASVVILLCVGYYFGQKPTSEVALDELVKLSPDYANEVVQYAKFINSKRVELKELTSNDPVLREQFRSELNNLENDYDSLKAKLPKNPNQEELIKAMIQNLEWQLTVLNQQLEIIQKIKKSTNENENEMV